MTKPLYHSLACGNLGTDKVKQSVIHIKEKSGDRSLVNFYRVDILIHVILYNSLQQECNGEGRFLQQHD